VFLSLSAAATGELFGSAVVALLGLALAFRGWQTLRSAPSTPTPAPQAAALSGPQPTSGGPVPMDDFFGAAPVNPAVVDARWHADYSQPKPSRALPSKSSTSTVAIIMLVVGSLLAIGGIFQSYQLVFNSGGITMPDQLLGMQRAAASSPLGQAVDQYTSSFNEGQLKGGQVAAYGDETRFVVVSAAEFDGSSGPAMSFQNLDQTPSTPGVNTITVDPGAKGGEVRCLEMTASQTVMCMWISKEALAGHGVVGAVFLGGSAATALDYASTVLTVRLAVEH